MKVLILGAKGTLGTQLMEIFPGFFGWDKEDCDVTNFEQLQSKMGEIKGQIDTVINCVAYNDVDGAESNIDMCILLNSTFPKNLVKICKDFDLTLVHFSTNFVFDGQKGEYVEKDEVNPQSIYGQSKVLGERAILEAECKAYIVRTSVLFGKKGLSPSSKRSFVDIMLDLSTSTNEVRVIKDEVNSVTYVVDLAQAVKILIETKPEYGIYHLTNSGQASWFDFAQEIFKLKHSHVVAIPILGKEMPRKAPRPKKAVLINTKLSQLRPWQDALAEFLTLPNTN